MKAALPCEYTDGQTDIRTPEVICNDFFENSTSNSFHSKFRALSNRYVVFRLMARVRAEQHIVMTGHSTRPPGIVTDFC